MTTLVTGGAGVVGSYVVRELIARGKRPIVLDAAPGSRLLRDCGGGIDFQQGDITDLDGLKTLCVGHRVETILHLAALTGAASNGDPMVMFRTNMVGTMQVLEAARLCGVRRVVMASTRTVYPDFGGTPYGNPRYAPVPEDHWLAPTRPYEVWKHAGERMGAFYRDRFALEFAAFRFAIYFAAERALTPATRAMGLLHAMIGNAVRGAPTAVRSGAERALDCIYVADLARAFALADAAPALRHSAYNIGSGEAVTAARFAAAVAAAVPGARIEVGPGIDFAPGHYCVLDIRRAREDFGYAPQWPLDAAVADCVQRVRALRAEQMERASDRP